jgi:predicted phage terminase large subunit-like protein
LQPGGAVVLIQTRWHHDDLAGWLLRERPEENWEVLNLPAIAEADGDGRKEGEALWPEQYPIKTLEGIRTGVGGATWAALYQQRPTAAEGEVFKREWWQRYSELPQFRRIVQSWDTAFKTGAEHDFSVCTTWGETKTGYYLLHAWRGRVEFPQLKRQVAALAAEWKPSAILVEDKASGQSLIQELKQGSRFPILAIKVDKDKLARAYSASPLVEAGKVFLPASGRSVQTALPHSSHLGWAEIRHPFHPLRGQRFEVLKKRRVAGVDTLILREREHGSFSIAREWTDWADPSVFELFSLPPCRLSAESLFELVTLLEHLTDREEKC